MAPPNPDDLPESLRGMLDTAVGLGILGFQRAQVERRAFERRLETLEPQLPDPARSVARGVRTVSESVGGALAAIISTERD